MRSYTARIFIVIAMAIAVLLPASTALASDSQLYSACNTNSQTATSPICANQGTKTDPAIHIVKITADLFALLTGVAAIILIVASGLTMITSSGNQESVASARKRMVAALVGVVIVALAWTLVNFLTDRLIKT